MPDENILNGIARRYALRVELGKQSAVEALGRHCEIGGGLCRRASARAPPICRAEGAGDIRGGVVEMVTRVALSHNNDEIELCLADGDVDGLGAVADLYGTDVLGATPLTVFTSTASPSTVTPSASGRIPAISVT